MKKDINIILGERIKARRKDVRLTREQLAEKINVSVRFLADVESGKVGVSLSTLKMLCDTLNVSADYLLGVSEHIDVGASLIKKIEKLPLDCLNSIEIVVDEFIKLTSK
ncbi:MAG: helix-turn-helix transcriptional regulator [Clostridia bacterium]|nr:helix-turn-helix transcriptional regulator [Clostridia bacterium]